MSRGCQKYVKSCERVSRVVKRMSRGGQEGVKSCEEGVKSCQGVSKSCLESAKWAPSTFQEGAKVKTLRVPLARACQEGSQEGTKTVSQ